MSLNYSGIFTCKKFERNLASTHTESRLSITQDLTKIKKNPEHPFIDTGKKEKYRKVQQKILKSIVVGAHKIF